MRTYVTGSGLQLVDACPGSAALDHVGHSSGKADVGSAFHDHARDRTLYTPGDAIDRIDLHADTWQLGDDDRAILKARARAWEWQPPPGCMGEVALGLMEDGRVEVVKGARGTYEGPPEMRVATRVDFFWAEPAPLLASSDGPPQCPARSTLWGMDLKTGSEAWVTPIEYNLQALCACVLPAIWTGARRAVACIVFPTRGPGTWDTIPAPLDEGGIARGRDALLAIAARANAARAARAAGEALPLKTGPHCQWCEAATYCPAKVGMIRAFFGGDPHQPVALSEDDLRTLAGITPQLEAFVASAKEALERTVKARGAPIILHDRSAWGAYTRPRKTIAPGPGRRALEAVVGEERAAAALKIQVSISGIRQAIKELHEERGIKRQVEPTVRSVLRELRAIDAIKDTEQVCYGRFRPPPELTAGAPSVPRALPAGPIEMDDGEEIE